MFDPVGAFKKQFTEAEGGYLIYPSRKSGGKLITAEEHDALVADWERVAGKARSWKTVGLVIAVIMLWTLLSEAFSLPEWTDGFLIAALAIAIAGWLLWSGFAPQRLVKNRPAITPPRTLSEAQRQGRAALNWPLVIFVLLISGAILFSTISTFDGTFGAWAWLIGSGLMLAAYLWIGVGKLFDRQR